FGILLLLLPIALFLFVLDGVYMLIADEGRPSALDVLFPRGLFFLIGCCFWPIGRRLVSGQERKGGGLLSPRTLAIVEPVLGVAATALYVSRRMAGWGAAWPGPIAVSEEPRTAKKRGKRS